MMTLQDTADTAARLLTAMANEKRLQILGHLLDNELSVNEIAQRVSLSQSALSQHLAKLRSAKLVETKRDKQMILYSCKSNSVHRMCGLLHEIFNNQ